MKANDEVVQRVYVNQEGMAIIKCPACSFKKITRVDSLIIRENDLRDNCIVRCACQKKFAVKLEFRGAYRKNSNFRGEYLRLPKGKPRGEMTVANISRNGIGFRIEDTTQLNKGDELLILFTLDEASNSLIEVRGKIRVTKQNYVGCEFLGSSLLGRALEAYLMDKPKETGPLADPGSQTTFKHHY